MVGTLQYTFLLLTILYTQRTNAQISDTSPCPRLFVYDTKKNEPGKWYGLVTLLNESDLKGIWLRLIFDRPSLQLGNYFGEVSTTDNKEYLIKNRNFVLKALTPQIVSFYIQYDTSQPPPRLVSIRQNARTVCPEGPSTDSPVSTPELQTSANEVQPSSTPSSGGVISETFGGSNSHATNTDEDDVFHGDFDHLFNRPISRPKPTDTSDLSSVCGTVISQPAPLITYGQATQEGEYPWHAALYHARGINLAYVCGASLVSKYHVITVAHCVTRKKSQIPLDPNNIVVYLGKYYLKRFSSPGLQDHQVALIIAHPQYNPQSYSNDIALLKLAEPAEITNYVRPVCLWQGSTDLNSIINKLGSIVGWGFDETGKVAERLTQTKMPVVTPETCLSSLPSFYSQFATKNSFCAGFRNGTSVCSGDSGGGMVFPRMSSTSKNPVWHLRGLISVSVALQNQLKCDTSHYVVFTDSAKYLDWIKQTMMK